MPKETFPDASSEPSSWSLLGKLLRDHADGFPGAVATVIWEDGARQSLGGKYLFRSFERFTDAEAGAVALCQGRVLDVGAGAGSHALVLQEAGLEVVALDVSPDAAAVMRRRGVVDARSGDIFTFDGESFDTLLLLMNGIGVVGDLAGLDRFLDHAHVLLGDGGQILLDSADIKTSDDPAEIARIVERVRAGKYRGETIQRIVYRGETGAPFPWLYIDAITLGSQAAARGWWTQVVFEGSEGDYLARLVRA